MTIQEKTLKCERIYEGKIINLRVDTVELPDRKYSKREIVEHGGAVGILPVTEDGKLILIRQFRKAVESMILEIPAGKLEEKEEPIQCAHRELTEETGLVAAQLTPMVDIYTSPGFCNERIHLYLATGLTQGEAHPDEDEYIQVVPLSLEEAMAHIARGEIKDSKTIIALLHYQCTLQGKL